MVGDVFSVSLVRARAAAGGCSPSSHNRLKHKTYRKALMALLTLPWRALRYRRAQGLLQKRVAETLPLVRSATPAKTASMSASTSGGLGGRTMVSRGKRTLCGYRRSLEKEKARRKKRKNEGPPNRFLRRLSRVEEGGGSERKVERKIFDRGGQPGERERRKIGKLQSSVPRARRALPTGRSSAAALPSHPLLISSLSFFLFFF